MQEYLLNPITLICLGTIFILVSLLFLYFKRHLSFLEKAQMDQARILQSFIANMEMTSMMQRGSGVGPGPGPELNIPHQMSEQYNDTQEELIDVSDDESSSDEETDSDDESVSQEPEVIELSNQPEEISYTNIKVIQLENDNLEEVTHLKIDKLNDDESDDDDSDDDVSDDDDESDDDKNNDDDNNDDEIIELTQPIEVSELSSIAKQLNIVKPPTIDYKTLNVTSLREIAENSGLIKPGEKINKKELINILVKSK